MSGSHSKSGRERHYFSPKPLKRYTVEEARSLFSGLLGNEFGAKARVQAEDYPPRALIEIALKARDDLKGVRGSCLNSGQMEEFASVQMDVPYAVVKAGHIASGCLDCQSLFKNVAKEIAPYFRADRIASSDYEIAQYYLQMGDTNLRNKRIIAEMAHADFLRACVRVRQKKADNMGRINKKII